MAWTIVERDPVGASIDASCKECGDPFTYTRKPVGRPALFCSVRCRSKNSSDRRQGDRKRAPPKKLVVGSRPCEVCGAGFALYNTTSPKVRTCSKRCGNILGSRGRTERAMARWADTSRDKYHAMVRSARLREGWVENVDRVAVFERDKWHCRICGRLTPPRLMGTFEMDAPELDHIIPISRRGKHSYSNTQCACRECNLRKGDGILTRSPDRIPLISWGN